MQSSIQNLPEHLAHLLDRVKYRGKDTPITWLPPEEDNPYYSLELPATLSTPETAWKEVGARYNHLLEKTALLKEAWLHDMDGSHEPDYVKALEERSKAAGLRHTEGFTQGKGFDRPENPVQLAQAEDGTLLLLIRRELMEDDISMKALRELILNHEEAVMRSWQKRVSGKGPGDDDDGGPGISGSGGAHGMGY